MSLFNKNFIYFLFTSGTDSRLGFGFRLGEHADFQVMVELGPQKNTRPIGDQDNMDGSSFNKRQVNKRQQLAAQQELTSTERSAATWLEKWSNEANTSTKKKISSKSKPTKKQILNKPVAIPTMQQLPDQTLRQLQMLYKMATSSTTEPEVTTTKRTAVVGEIDPATHLQERLKLFKAPPNVEELQVLHKRPEKSKTEITKELMDVNLD